MKIKRTKVRIPFVKNQKAGAILSKKDKERKRDRKKAKTSLKHSCWED